MCDFKGHIEERVSVLSADFSESNFYTTHPNQSLLPLPAQKLFLEED